jgi:hypothetical protein
VIGWSTIAPVLVDLTTRLARDDSLPTENFSAEWKERSRSFTHDGQSLSLLLKVTTVATIGDDETRYENHEGGLRASQHGQRRVTLQVQAIVPEHTDELWAMAALERLRTRIRRPGSLTELLAVGVALIEDRQAVKVSFKDAGRWVSAANMDLVLAVVVNDVDPVPMNWIERIELTSHLTHAPDVDAAAALNVTGELLPPE